MSSEITQQVPFFRLDCGQAERDNVSRVLDSGWLTTGEWAMRFEREFAEAVGARHALAVNSCTAALHLALEAIGVSAGDEVLVPSLTFAATAEVVRYLGATPVLADVDVTTGCLGPEQVKAALNSHKLKAVIPVHFAGHAADIPAIRAVCDPLGIDVIEDAAHAFPARIGGRYIGGLSRCTCFSFYANKTITTGEGGMVTTDDDALAARMKLMRIHGIDRDAWGRYRSAGASWRYDVVAPGFKYNLPDLAAAVGVAQLSRSPLMHSRRTALAMRYLAGLRTERSIRLPASPSNPSDHAWHIFVVRIAPELAESRDRAITMLGERGIATSMHYWPLHRMTYYSALPTADAKRLPVAEDWGKTAISLPLFSTMSDLECDAVIAAVRETMRVLTGAR